MSASERIRAARDWQEGAGDALTGREKRTEHGEYAKGYTYVVLSRALRRIAA